MSADPALDLADAIAAFVALRRRLLACLPEPLARSGEIALDGTWRYRRHGGGVAFREDATGLLVDAPELGEGLDEIDVLVLSGHFGSMGRRGVKLVERAAGRRGPLEVLLAEALERLAARGHGRWDGHAYRVRE